jgi:mannose-6-phosphate isomerase-like protein (cupin superfamily)
MGGIEQGPVYSFDHLALLAKGRLAVHIKDEVTEFTAPQMIYVKAGLRYKLVALTDNTVVYSVHTLREPSGDIVSADMVPKSRELYELVQGLVVTS